MYVIYLCNSLCGEYAPLSLRSLGCVLCPTITLVISLARICGNASLDRVARQRGCRFLVIPIVDWWDELTTLQLAER